MRRRGLALLTVAAMLASCTKLVDEDRVVVATVGGDKIRLGEVVQRIRQTPPQARLQTNTAEGRTKILEELINETLLLNAAAAQGVTLSEEEIEARVQQEQAAQAQAAAAAGAETLPAVRDREAIVRNLRIEKLLEGHLSPENIEARYRAQLLDGPPRETVQYDFAIVKASNPNLALGIIESMKAGVEGPQLIATFRGHPDFVNGGRTAPLYVDLLEPWLQRELAIHQRPGSVLPAWQGEIGGQPSMMVVRLINRWHRPPLGAVYESLVDELYEQYLHELRAAHPIERFPERLRLIERR